MRIFLKIYKLLISGMREVIQLQKSRDNMEIL